MSLKKKKKPGKKEWKEVVFQGLVSGLLRVPSWKSWGWTLRISLSPDLHVNAGMRRRLKATYRSSVGWDGMTFLQLHEPPPVTQWNPISLLTLHWKHWIRHSLQRSRTGLVWAATHLFNAAAFPSPAFLRPPRPLTRGRPRRQKVKNMLQKKKTYTLSTSLSDWQKNPTSVSGTES